MSRVIGVLSGKGGVGKTALVANLGAALAKDFGKTVAILDTDVNSSHLGMHFGLYRDAPVTLREVLEKGAPIYQGLYVHPETGVSIMAAPLNGHGSRISPKKLAGVARKMAEDHGIVLMDCAPGLGKEVVTSISAMDAAIVVTTPDFPAVADALKTLQLLDRMRKPILGIVVNKSRGKKFELTPREIESTCGRRVISVIPEDSAVPKGVSRGSPAVHFRPFGKSGMAFKRLGGALVNERYEGGSLAEVVMSLMPRMRRGAPTDERLDDVKKSVLQPKRKKV